MTDDTGAEAGQVLGQGGDEARAPRAGGRLVTPSQIPKGGQLGALPSLSLCVIQAPVRLITKGLPSSEHLPWGLSALPGMNVQTLGPGPGSSISRLRDSLLCCPQEWRGGCPMQEGLFWLNRKGSRGKPRAASTESSRGG